MKYGRALRITRLALTVAIIAILVVPLVMSIAGTNVTQIKPGVQSVYELDAFDTGSGVEAVDKQVISYNLSLVKESDGSDWDGNGKLVFERESGSSQTLSTSSISGAVDAIYSNRMNYDTVAVCDSNGTILTQESIQYHDTFQTTVVTGMKVPNGVNGLATYSVDLSFVGKDVDFRIQYGTSEVKDGYLVIKTEIPDILNLLCNSVDHDMEFKVHVSVLAVANFDVDIDVMTAKIIPSSYDPSTHSIIFENVAVGTADTIKIGDNVQYSMSGKNVSFKSNSSNNISVELRELYKDTGKLTFVNSAHPEQTMIIKGLYAYDIISIVEYLEGQ